MGLEVILANVPKWLLDKRALNQPVLPIADGRTVQIQGSGASGDAYYNGLEYWSRINYYIQRNEIAAPGTIVVTLENEPVGAEKQIYEFTGPGVVSALMGWPTPYYALRSGSYGTSSYYYQMNFRAELDGQAVNPAAIAANSDCQSYYSANGQYYLVRSQAAVMIGGIAAGRSVPLYVKDHLRVYVQVTTRSVSSSLNKLYVLTDAVAVK